MTAIQALEIHRQFVSILKKRFTNLGVEELSDLTSQLVVAAATVLQEPPR